MVRRTPWTHRDRRGDVVVLFTGRVPQSDRDEAGRDREILRLVPPGVEPAWLRQIHSPTVVTARRGDCGEGDALVSGDRDLALAVVTADCVPVLISSGVQIAAVHAGWRGLESNVIGHTVAALGEPPEIAWIGPAIGPCCYEVSEEVAGRIEQSVDIEPRRAGRGDRPHLDLPAVAASQLRQAGTREVITVERCTRCHPDDLWSYRRDAAAAGRNFAIIWRRSRESSLTG